MISVLAMELGESPPVGQTVAVVALLVVLSVVLQGVSAGPLGSHDVLEQSEHGPAVAPRSRRTAHHYEQDEIRDET